MITIQIGQCGNQVGAALFDALADEALDETRAHHRATFERFFRLGGGNHTEQAPIARAVLIDMEPKVIQSCLDSPRQFRYDAARTFARQSGSANNWAFGYHVHGPASRDAILDRMRREAECADRLTGFLALHSLAGGTGSGVGTRAITSVHEAQHTSAHHAVRRCLCD